MDLESGRRSATPANTSVATIVPAEPASWPGEVRRLSSGGVAVLAIPRFQDYSLDAAEPVFRAPAPVLPPGRPRLIIEPPASSPTIVAAADPALAAAADPA